jgi:hypothetical protein
MHLIQAATDAAGSASFRPTDHKAGQIRVQPSGVGPVTVDIKATLTPDEAGPGSSILPDGPVTVTGDGAIIQYANRQHDLVTVVYSGLPEGQTLDVWVTIYDGEKLGW